MSNLDDILKDDINPESLAFYDDLAKAKQQIKASMLELIGEDEHNKAVDVTYQEWRNELRYELRQKVEEL